MLIRLLSDFVSKTGIHEMDRAVAMVYTKILRRIEILDESWIGRRYFNQESMKKVMEPELLLVADHAPFCLAPVH